MKRKHMCIIRSAKCQREQRGPCKWWPWPCILFPFTGRGRSHLRGGVSWPAHLPTCLTSLMGSQAVQTGEGFFRKKKAAATAVAAAVGDPVLLAGQRSFQTFRIL